MKFSVNVDMDNDAFAADPYGELARILREVANDAEQGANGSWTLQDANGNTVGKASLK